MEEEVLEEMENETQIPDLKLSKMTNTYTNQGQESMNTMIYRYDIQNRLVEVESTTPNLVTTAIYHYKNDQIVLLESSHGGIRNYMYENGRVIESNWIRETITLKYVYEYDNFGYLSKKTEYIDGDVNCVLEFNNDISGNTILSIDPCNEITSTLEYDTKPNVYLRIGLTNGFKKINRIGLNNYTRTTKEYTTGTIITDFVYTYNSDNYPSQTKLYQEGNLVSTYDFFYE